MAASQCTNSYLRSCCVSMSDKLNETSVGRLDSDPVSPGWGVCVSMIWWCGIEEEDDNEMKYEVLRNI